MKIRCYQLCLLVFIFSCHCLYGQQTFFPNTSWGIQMNYGSFLTMDPKAQYLKDSYSYFGELYFQRVNKEWSTTKKIEWGGSILFGNTGSKQYMGHMAGMFPFINMPLIQNKNFESKIRIGAGLGWIEKPYDRVTNHKNIMIGSTINGLFHFLWQNEYIFSKHLSANIGLSFTHLSNGASTLPNLGINIPAVSFGLRYVGKEVRVVQQKYPEAFNRMPMFSIYTSVGVKQLPWVGSQRYLVNIFNAELVKRYRYNKQLGAGVILFYDRSMQVNPYTITSDKRKNKNVQAGIYLSYEHFFGKLSLPLQLNAYVYNRDIYSVLFQQLGVRYKVTKQLTVQAMLKTHGGKADVIHAGIGYTLK